jgi:hypothetical protein
VPLTDANAVTAALLRPLTAFETTQLDELITQASDALTTALLPSSLSGRMVLDSTDPAFISATAVRRVLADVIARRLSNPERLQSQSEGDGPFTQSKTYGQRSGDAAPPGVVITDADLAALVGKVVSLPSSIKLDTSGVLGCADALVSGYYPTGYCTPW